MTERRYFLKINYVSYKNILFLRPARLFKITPILLKALTGLTYTVIGDSILYLYSKLIFILS